MIKKFSKKTKIWLVVLAMLVLARLVMPYFIVKYVNKVLANDIAPYKGHIYDVDLSLYRGAYRICDMKIDKVNENGKTPFVHAPHIDLSIEWKSLLEGSLVGEVVLEEPRINFKLSKQGSQTGEGVDWVKLVEDLMPTQINRFAVENGTVTFNCIDGKAPDFNIDFKDFELEAKNIRNVEEKEIPLPSSVMATANAPGYGGLFKFDGKAMFLKKIPDFDFNAKFENGELKGINEVFRYYSGGMDFEKGKLNMYSEMAMKDGSYKGYFKPILIDATIFNRKEEDRSFKQGAKELFAEGIQEVFENHKKDQTAFRVPIQGKIEATRNSSVWKTIISAFSNAYIRAFQFKLDDTINFKSVAKKEGEKKEKEGFFHKFRRDKNKEN